MPGKPRANPDEVIEKAFLHLGKTDTMKMALQKVMAGSLRKEPKLATNILEPLFSQEKITRIESETIKGLICIKQIQTAIAKVLQQQKVFSVDTILREYTYGGEENRRKIIQGMNIEQALIFIEILRQKARIQMILQNPENPEDDRLDLQIYEGKSGKVFVTPEKICILFLGQNVKLELEFVEILHRGAYDITDNIVRGKRMYCIVQYENGNQGMISLDSGLSLALEDMVYLKYGDIKQLRKEEGTKEDKFLYETFEGEQVQFITSAGRPTQWKAKIL